MRLFVETMVAHISSLGAITQALVITTVTYEAYDKTHHMTLSGTKVRGLLRDVQCPPPEFTRPEVAEVLIDGLRDSEYQV